VTPKTSDRQQLLLDTHVWLWLVLASEALGSSARRAISRAAYVGNLRIAEMTVWEVGLLAPRRRNVQGKPTIAWVEEAVAARTVMIVPLSPPIAVESWELPGTFHGRPGRPDHRCHCARDRRNSIDTRSANS
jgi:PIN domain nuclease of toxin-antitoxin system